MENILSEMKMTRNDFEELVGEALDGLPDEIAVAMENVSVMVEQWPSQETIKKLNLRNRYELLGLYEGVPLLRRGVGYGGALPDRITIFKGPIEACENTREKIKERIQIVVIHEIAHHFGIGEARLRELGY